jgi:hypothetical protein
MGYAEFSLETFSRAFSPAREAVEREVGTGDHAEQAKSFMAQAYHDF